MLNKQITFGLSRRNEKFFDTFQPSNALEIGPKLMDKFIRI